MHTLSIVHILGVSEFSRSPFVLSICTLVQSRAYFFSASTTQTGTAGCDGYFSINSISGLGQARGGSLPRTIITSYGPYKLEKKKSSQLVGTVDYEVTDR